MSVTKSFFQRIPFIRISSLFLIGILINHYIPIDFNWIGIVLFLLLAMLIFFWDKVHFAGVKYQNLLIWLCILLSGIFYPAKVSKKPFSYFDQKDNFWAEVCQKPMEKANTFQSILLIQSSWMPKPEKVIAYFSKEDFDSTLIPGDQLILFTQARQIKNRGNPFEFDYRQMMQNKGIFYSVYMPVGTYKKTGIQVKRLSYQAEQIRDRLLSLLAISSLQKEERSVVSALTLGYRTELEPETRDYFASTGAMHVLAVSGLHVGLIYLIISTLFSVINTGKTGSFIYSLSMIVFLWGYAFITGFSPSVQRATVMFTFIIIGNAIRRPVNIYNSLSASALVLILHNPNVVFEISFQLSYLAVFGIVLLQPPLAKILPVKNKMLKWLWTLFTVSLAAQLATFPLGIFYFNQFPNFFWVSNFFVIPAAAAIIWLTFGFFVLSPLPWIPGLIAKLIQFITHLMLDSLKWVSSLPHALSEGIIFNPLQVWIMYGLIASSIIYVFSKNKKWLFIAMILLISFQINTLWTNCNLFNQKIVYVFNSQSNVLQFINGRENYVVNNSKKPITEQEINMIENVCNHLKLKDPKFLDPSSWDDFEATDLKISSHTIQFLNCRIKFANQLQFNIQGFDLLSFKSYNRELLREKIINTTSTRNGFDNNNIFLIDFTSKSNEAIFLRLE